MGEEERRGEDRRKYGVEGVEFQHLARIPPKYYIIGGELLTSIINGLTMTTSN